MEKLKMFQTTNQVRWFPNLHVFFASVVTWHPEHPDSGRIGRIGRGGLSILSLGDAGHAGIINQR